MMQIKPEQAQDLDELYDLMYITKQTPMNMVNHYKTQISQIMYHLALLGGIEQSLGMLHNMYTNLDGRREEFQTLSKAFRDKVDLMRDLASIETAK